MCKIKTKIFLHVSLILNDINLHFSRLLDSLDWLEANESLLNIILNRWNDTFSSSELTKIDDNVFSWEIDVDIIELELEIPYCSFESSVIHLFILSILCEDETASIHCLVRLNLLLDCLLLYRLFNFRVSRSLRLDYVDH
jgi:hypothetical protein